MDNSDRTVNASWDGAVNMYDTGLFGRMRRILREKGAAFLMRKSAAFALRHVYARTFLRYRRERSFSFGGREYSYFNHPYNFTWDNERSVEIPIALDRIASFGEGRVLEAGNVLSHYVPAGWDVLDKFERATGVINCDLAEYRPDSRYDLIVSISTLEHVGFDDDVRDPDKIPAALANLRDNCLKPGGEMLFTMPLGYNQSLDESLFSGELGFDDLRYLKRASRHEWVEVSRDDLGDYRYATTYIEAGAVVIAGYHGSAAGKS